jgi:hypothetical protein
MAWPQLDWPQISVGAVLGWAGNWIAGVTRSFMDARIQEWGKDRDEERKIRAQARDEERNSMARRQEAADILAKHENELLSLKTSLNGSTDLLTAAHYLQAIHQFFGENPQYIAVGRNRQFLEEWPFELKGELSVDPNQIKHGNRAQKLAVLKTAVNGLKVSER